MGIMNLLKTNLPGNDAIKPDYDAIDPVATQTNLLVATDTKERQTAIKRLRIGSLVTLKRTTQNGHVVYVVSDLKTGKVVGEISYGTSEYLDQNYRYTHVYPGLPLWLRQ